ncbi:MAG: glycosyltransferase family 2 protein, partial [Victivallales bacterium]|nr:glycosyltransferase family 2 protein [Victivallales bacterium]
METSNRHDNFGLVTVIIPVFNTAKYLVKCLDSVLGQTYRNIEVLAVDDGSTDGSSVLLSEYARRDSRLTVLTQENQGLSVARNTGLDAMNPETKYVCFVDSDDWLPDDSVASMLDCLEKKAADMVCGLYDIWNDKQRMDWKCPQVHLGDDDVVSRKEIFYMLTNHLISNYTHSWGKLYKVHVVKGCYFPPGKVFEDNICHRFYGKCNSIAFLNGIVYHYLRREGSITHSGFDERRLDIVEIYVDRIQYFREEGFAGYSIQVLM